MTQLAEIQAFLDDYLAINDISDSCWNGLQVAGNEEVSTIGLAVDAGQSVFTEASKKKTDFLLVHHGHFWHESNPSLTSWQKERVTTLLDNNMSLYAAHLPLDHHREVGNNAQLLQLLDAPISEPFHEKDGINIGWIGQRQSAITRDKIVDLLEENLEAACTVLPFGPKQIKRIAVVSGGGSYSGMFDALAANVDLYLTGDAVEVYQLAKDAKQNVIFAGHYATETLGVKAVGTLLQEKFNVATHFIDQPTGL